MGLGRFIGIAIVKQKLGIQKLFEVPVAQVYQLEPGDEVLYESIGDPDEVEKGEVVCTACCYEHTDFFEFVLAEHHEAQPLRRIISKIEYITMDYSEEKADE